VVIYPQGGIRPSLGATKPKAGVGLVATSTGAPVIPAGIIDATTLHRSGFLRFPRITVRFGEGSSYIETAAHEVAEIVWEQVIELNLRGH
jgi:1-acyl-sn-glycerol-3-phosphate acyltransferase